MATKVQVYFVLKGTFDPDTVTNTLNIKPTEQWREGQKGKSGIKKKYDSWIVSTGYVETLDSEDLVEKVYKILLPSKDLISKVIKDFSLIANFIVVAKVEDQETPSLGFENYIVKFAGEIGASFEIDLYVN